MDGETIIMIAGIPVYGFVMVALGFATLTLMKAGSQMFESTQAQQVQENTAGNAPK